MPLLPLLATVEARIRKLLTRGTWMGATVSFWRRETPVPPDSATRQFSMRVSTAQVKMPFVALRRTIVLLTISRESATIRGVV